MLNVVSLYNFDHFNINFKENLLYIRYSIVNYNLIDITPYK